MHLGKGNCGKENSGAENQGSDGQVQYKEVAPWRSSTIFKRLLGHRYDFEAFNLGRPDRAL